MGQHVLPLIIRKFLSLNYSIVWVKKSFLNINGSILYRRYMYMRLYGQIHFCNVLLAHRFNILALTCQVPIDKNSSYMYGVLPWSLKSSTSMISSSRWAGERLMTLVMVRRRTVYASLWKMITTDVVGRSEEYRRSTHLQGNTSLSLCPSPLPPIPSSLSLPFSLPQTHTLDLWCPGLLDRVGSCHYETD